MGKLINVFVLLILLVASLNAQNPKLEQFLSRANETYEEGDYYSALTYYELALEYKDNQPVVSQRLAETALYFKAYTRAEKAFRSIIRNQPEEKSAKYWLGFVLQHQGRYEDAKHWYEQYIDTGDDDEQLMDEAYKGIEDCNFAAAAIAEPKDVIVQHLDTTVNTPDAEFNAFPLGDTLYYSTLQNVFEDDDHFPPRKYSNLYYRIEGQVGQKMPASINLEGKHVSNITFNPAKDRMFFTLCDYVTDNKIRCDLYAVDIIGPNRWGEKVAMNINQEGVSTTQPTIGFDEEVGQEILYFISDREGGKGGMDIWAAYFLEDGTLDTPFNVEELNTTRDEQTPFFHSPSQRLYFSSKGYESFGGFDIYNSQKTNGEWSVVYNMGSPINSSYDDIYYLRSDCSGSYFASNRWDEGIMMDTEPGKETCCYDIYSVDLVPNVDLNLIALDCEDNMDLNGVRIEVYRDLGGGRRKLKDTVLDPEGNDFKLRLSRCEKYIIEASKPNYNPYTLNIDLTEYSEEFGDNIPTEFDYPDEIYKEICLEPLQVELVIKPCDAEDKTNIMTGVHATFSLLDLENGTTQIMDEEIDSPAPEILFQAYVGKTYELKLEKLGYQPRIDTLTISQEQYEIYGQRITIEACLERIEPVKFLPMSLYFDNAIPGPHPDRATDKIYEDLYTLYYGKKVEFIDNFTEGLEESERFRLSQGFELFFEREVREQGRERFVSFCEALLEYLKGGNSFSISITGFASPRGPSDYNMRLSMRRVDSVVNFLEQYRDGAFVPYLRSGKLYIDRQYFGEDTAASTISADLEDRKNSIFSVVASVERRVEVKQLSSNPDNDNTRR